MVRRTLERCIVLGEPGSGKSTLVQWICRAVNQGRIPDFDLAISVKLSAFAEALQQRSRLSLSEFFFDGLGLNVASWRSAADRLRPIAGDNRRCLFLLDGWDEVPAQQRDAVRRCIRDEDRFFVTLVTSRPAGQPAYLWAKGAADVYHVAGLASRATEALVRNLLTSLERVELADRVVGRVMTEPDLREMAANPFLLGLLVRVLVRAEGSGQPAGTLAQVYDQVVEWIKAGDGGTGKVPAITAGHMAALYRLSHDLLFDPSSPRYLFHRRELEEKLGLLTPDPLLAKRFINCVDPAFDEYVFLHATFEEFFAAVHANALSSEELDRFLGAAFRSASRLIVLEFVAGLGGRAERRCRERVAEWLQSSDRFGQVLLRAARLVVAGRWQLDKSGGLARAVSDDLWRQIESLDDMEAQQAAVAALSQIDPRDLCRRARRAKEISNWVLNCMVELVPPAVAREERLDELISPEWRDYAGFDLRGGATAEELAGIRLGLAAENRDDRLEAIRHAGAARGGGAVPALLAIVENDDEDMDLRQQAIDSLAAIGGRVATEPLVELITAGDQKNVDCVRMAATALRSVEGSRGALDPLVRDLLLRRLAILPLDDWRIEYILTALEGHPIRDGASIIAEIAMCSDVRAEVRAKAVAVLATVADRRLLQQVIAGIESESSGEVVGMLLHLAVARSLRVTPVWLQKKISECRDRVRLHQFVKSYVLLLPQVSSADWTNAVDFVHRLVARVMKKDSSRSEELAKALTAAFSLAQADGKPLLSERTFELSRDTLAEFAEKPGDLSEGRTLLAVSIVTHSHQRAARVEMRKALDTALSRVAETKRPTRRPDRITSALANGLADIAPEELLDYSLDCEPVQAALRRRALERGWMVFTDRIADSEGNEIARKGGTSASIAVQAPAELKDIVESLPPEMQRALRGYWVMVRQGGPCGTADPLPSIHAAMRQRFASEIEDRTADELDQLFPEGAPELENWRKTLNRIEKRFRGRPEMELLRRLGLYRREKRRR